MKPLAKRPKSLLVCVNRRFQGDKPSCAQRGSEAIADAIEEGIARRGIDLAVERLVCMGQCMDGPTLRLAPGGEFILGVTLEDVPDLLDRFERECRPRDDDVPAPAVAFAPGT